MKHIICAFMMTVAMLHLNLAFAQNTNNDENAIRHVLMSTWDKPELPLKVESIAIVENDAVASWTQGNRGGRALMLKQANGEWIVRACGGDNLKDVKILQQSSISSTKANALLELINTKEALLLVGTRKLFSTFDEPTASAPSHHVNNDKSH